MTGCAPLLERICESPDDDGPRLIYADWLDERGDPLGRFIRVQCALASLPADDSRRFPLRREERQLLADNAAAWEAPVRGIATNVTFRRGFVASVTVETKSFLARADDLFRLAPVTHVRFLDVGSSLPRLIACQRLARLTSMTLFAQHLGDRLARALADCEHLGDLRELELGRNRIGDEGVQVLAHAPRFATLNRLDLSENGVGDVGAASLAAAPGLPSLEWLQLRDNAVTADGLSNLARSVSLGKLNSLGLRGNEAGTVRGRPTPAEHGGLRSLDLRGNNIGPVELSTLLGLPQLAGLRRLDLGGNPLGTLGVRELARSPRVESLRALWLDRCDVTDIGLRELSVSQCLFYLGTLDLSENPLVSDFGARSLLDPARFRGLRRLGVPREGLSPRVRRLLQARFAGLHEDRAV